MAVLFVGRFQPFHLGHLDALRQILKKEEQVIIVIGSAEDDFVPENPFTASERFMMIDAALREDGVSREKYVIIPLRDIKNYSLWVKHLESLTPPFSKVYTGSSVVRILFRKAGYEVRTQKINLEISATRVRKALLEKKGWKSMVPKSVAKLLVQWKAEKRLEEIEK